MYDPLGFVAPVILPTKSLLQSLCNWKHGWDKEISDEDSVIWQGWLKEIDSLGTLSAPRCFKLTGLGEVTKVQRHHFGCIGTWLWGGFLLTNHRL